MTLHASEAFTAAGFNLGAAEKSAQSLPAGNLHTFEPIRLEAVEVRFEPWVTVDGKRRGPNHIDIEYLGER